MLTPFIFRQLQLVGGFRVRETVETSVIFEVCFYTLQTQAEIQHSWRCCISCSRGCERLGSLRIPGNPCQRESSDFRS